MWPGLIEWARSTMLAADPPLAGVDDFGIPCCAPDADTAIALLRKYHARWVDRQQTTPGVTTDRTIAAAKRQIEETK